MSYQLVCGYGLVGRGLVDHGFAAIDPSVDSILGRSVGYSVSQRREIKQQLMLKNFKVFVNAAGPSNVFESLSNPSEYIEFPWQQCLAQLSVLRELPKPPVYVFISSGSVYGDTGVNGVSENFSPSPVSPYAQGKLKAELFLRDFSNTYSGGIVILRCFSIYSEALESRLPSVIANSMAKNGSLTLSGTGQELRDFIHVKDVATAIEVASRPATSFEVYNVGTGVGISVKEICKIAAVAFKIEFIENETVFFNGEIRKSDPKNLVADISKIAELGFSISIHPHEGILRYFQSKNLK